MLVLASSLCNLFTYLVEPTPPDAVSARALNLGSTGVCRAVPQPILPSRQPGDFSRTCAMAASRASACQTPAASNACTTGCRTQTASAQVRRCAGAPPAAPAVRPVVAPSPCPSHHPMSSRQTLRHIQSYVLTRDSHSWSSGDVVAAPAGANNVRSAATAAALQTRPFLHTLFSDNMVLARGMTGSVFGWTTAGAQVRGVCDHPTGSSLGRTPWHALSVSVHAGDG